MNVIAVFSSFLRNVWYVCVWAISTNGLGRNIVQRSFCAIQFDEEDLSDK